MVKWLKKNPLFGKALIAVTILALVFPAIFAFAQTPEEEKKALEEELKTLEEQITKYEGDINQVQGEKKTLQNQIQLLNNKIKKLDLQIYQGNLMIKDLTLQVKDTETGIEKTNGEIEKTRLNLKENLRLVYQEDDKAWVEILLSEDRLSSFFDAVFDLEILASKTKQSLADIKSLKLTLEEEKSSLDKEKGDLSKLIGQQGLQKQTSVKTKSTQEQILTQTKGKEALYQQYLKETQKKAAEIRARIFELIGVAKAPTFGEAYELAKMISKNTGIRPAFLLAIITQESNLGKNVGQCNCAQASSCKHPELTWKEVMKKGRDWDAFLEIAQGLGRDPNSLPVSCPMYLNGKVMGYGGAMGPAQFIPSTWLSYKDRIEKISGRVPADPWNISDAFLAAALYVKDFGADSQKEKDEWKAAMIYFSGSTNTKYRFYGDQVIAIAKDLEQDIKAINTSASLNINGSTPLTTKQNLP